MTLEEYWGTPRDVELAKDAGGSIKIVQDRPVTTLGAPENAVFEPAAPIRGLGNAVTGDTLLGMSG